MKKWTGEEEDLHRGVHGRCRSSQPPQDGAGLSNYTYSTARRGVAVGGGGRRRRRRRRKYSAVLQIRPKGGESLGEDSEIFAPSSNSVKSEGEKGEKLEKEGRGGGRKIRIWCI